MKKVLAIDMGATSIRGILGYISEGALVTREVMRMPHDIVRCQGRMRWEWDRLLSKVGETLVQMGEEITSVGIDTWGVDFGLIDREGNLVADPVSYRDPENGKGYEAALGRMEAKDIFLKTGNQIMPINTLFQLVTLKEHYKEEWKKAEQILLMPDLFNYMLTGNRRLEETILSTTQVFDLKERRLSRKILDRFDIAAAMFPPVVKAGTVVGNTRGSRVEALRGLNVSVIAVCGHDTASAVLLTDAFRNPDSLFLSCGTWSLLGGLTDRAVMDDGVFEKSLTNELGYGSRNLFFKNITGLYLLEKFRKQMGERLGTVPEFDEITAWVKEDAGTSAVINIEEAVFGEEDVDAKAAIDAYLNQTGQLLPKEDMGYFKVIYESLVQKYVETVDAIQAAAGKTYNALHMIGGGAKSPLLCQMIADRMELPVTAGPFEAAALGNIITQLTALGEVDSIEEGIRLAWEAARVVHYKPMTQNSKQNSKQRSKKNDEEETR